MPRLEELAPAKLNLHLHVVGRRPDGYHLLDSLVVFAGAADRLTVEPATDLSLVIDGPFAEGLMGEPDNLVLRAARALAKHAGIRPHGRVVLEKNLPIASGIGGGSADAAAALRLLCRFWSIDASASDLHRIGLGLGADVPVCLMSRPARMSGIGEHVVRFGEMPDVGLVLINPGVVVSTPSVFKARIAAFSSVADLEPDATRSAGALAQMLWATTNDLEAPAIGVAPVIAEVMAALRSAPRCLLARMSGSGATCFGLFGSPAEAKEAAGSLARPGWWAWAGGLFSPPLF